MEKNVVQQNVYSLILKLKYVTKETIDLKVIVI